MTSAAAASPAHHPAPTAASSARWTIDARWLLLVLAAWLMMDQLLLWRFLGLSNPFAFAAAMVAIAALLWQLWRASAVLERIPMLRIALLFGFALTLYALGGEGRFFYANIDWQVRDAVLRDMAIHPWPFAYVPDGGEPTMLRAAIGFFLIPALAWKAWGPTAGDIALLVQNSLLLTALLALGSTLFTTTRARALALLIVTLFSGADIIGQAIFQPAIEDHKEFWFDWMQYSAHVTQAFWVPQHALAGWIIALALMLWHSGQVPLRIPMMLAPLTLLWSPLPLIGALPLIGYAAWATWRGGTLRLGEVGWPLVASVLTLPALAYLGAGGDGVGIRPYPLQLAAWAIFIALEVLIWAVPLWLVWRNRAGDRALLAVAVGWLLVCPFIQIGWSIDFMMRASIPALAIIALFAARTLVGPHPRWVKLWLCGALTLGSVTGGSEVWRAIKLPPSPRGTCSFYGAWDVSFARYPKGSHLAPVHAIPAPVRPATVQRVPVADPTPCWRGDWPRPSGV